MGVLDLSAYELTDEHRELASFVRAFADERVAPQAYEADRTKTLPLDIVAEMGEMGLFGLPFPEDYGGQGGDYVALGLAIEALGRVDQSIAITLEAGVSLGAMPVFRFGTDEQRAQLLPDLLAGRALAGFGLTEPEAGSDAGGTRTTARRDGDDWVINGAKQFITNSGTAITRFVTVTAVTGERDGRKEISTIIVPAGTPGFTVGPAYDKVGWHASDTHPLTFTDARVPRRTCWASVDAGTRTSSASSTRGGSRSRRCRRAPRRDAWKRPSTMHRPARCSATGSGRGRRSNSCSRVCSCASTMRGSRGCTPHDCTTRGSRSARRRRSRS